MKILHLTTHLNRGGISKYIYSVGNDFVKKGHEIYVCSSGGEMDEEFRIAGIRQKTLPIKTKSELSPNLYWILPSLIRWIRAQKIDVIHAHTRVTQVMADWIWRLTGIPYVTTAHGFYKRRLGRRLFPAWGLRTIAISEAVGADLHETHHLTTNQIRVIYNGLDLLELTNSFSKYDPRNVLKEYGFFEHDYVMGIVARLVPDKGHEYLIRALKSLETDFPNLKLLIVGDGKHRDYLEDLSNKQGLTNRIHFTGNLKDVAKPLAAIDLFVLPAVWREGFGLSIVEAMACQKPVIVTNIWALNTLIQDRVNGIMVEPRDTEHLARAIRQFITDPALSKRIGMAGQETAHVRFSIGRMVQELEKVYEEVLSR